MVCYINLPLTYLLTYFNFVVLQLYRHRRTGQFFSRGAEPSSPEKFSDIARKTALLTCKITLPNSPHPIIISINSRFWALYLARRKEFRFFV